MARLDDLKAKLKQGWESIRDSEAYQQIKTKYDDLDSDQKLYVNLGGMLVVVAFVLSTVLYGMVKVSGLKSDINDREELIGFLQNASDNVKQLKAQQSAQRSSSVDLNAPLPDVLEQIMLNADFDPEKVEISNEITGKEEKNTKEVLVDVKMTQTNIRQMTRLLFAITEQGSSRALNIKNLDVDTKGDPSGYVDVAFTVSSIVGK